MARRVEGVTPTGALRLLQFVKGSARSVREARAQEEIEERKARYMGASRSVEVDGM